MDITQSQIRMGMPFIKRDNPDIFNLLVGNYILGSGGFNSRLMEALREKHGFVYGISSNFMPWEQSGLFMIDLQTKISQNQPAIKLVKTTIDDFLHNGINQQELDKAKRFLLQSFSSRLDTNEKWLSQLSTIAFYNLPLNYLDTWQQNINNTSIESVNSAMRKYLDTSQLNTSIVTKN
jgi:zinc protease